VPVKGMQLAMLRIILKGLDLLKALMSSSIILNVVGDDNVKVH
jgi:hypothetical protein